jgi:ATP adenylyltransferase
MDSIWAPWRRTYVTSGVETPGCVFCRALERAAEPESLVVHVAPLSLVLVNLFPYNSGHVMVAPRRHIAILRMLYKVIEYRFRSLFVVVLKVCCESS